MTITEWEQQNTGIVLKVPAGTVITHDWEYQHPDGRWLRGNVTMLKQQGLDWTSSTPKRYVAIKTPRDQYVELTIKGITSQALKAIRSKSGKSVDGPLTVKRRR